MTVRTRALHLKHQKQHLLFKIPRPPPIPPPPLIPPSYNFRQTLSVERDPLDLFFWALLLDMVQLGTQQLRAGLGIFVFCKVSHVKHPNEHTQKSLTHSHCLSSNQEKEYVILPYKDGE